MTPSGAVDCWGSNTYGQATDQPGPSILLSAGGDHTCALTPSGAVDCWGDNNFGQATDQPGPYTRLSAGNNHTCALTPSGTVDCWGDNSSGEATDQPGPYTQLSAEGDHTCALTPSGAVDCWGSNTFGQAEDQPGPYTFVSAGYYHTCALTSSGALDCWGLNDDGEAEDHPGPYTQFSLGRFYTCALTPSGAVDCWGDSGFGQAEDQPGPYTQLSAGDLHTCALTPSAAIDCWGSNSFGKAEDQPGPYGWDLVAPETTIDSGPADPSNAGVAFTFSSDDPTATFACQLDAGGWAACASPQTYMVLTTGEHTFQVRAADPLGNTDTSPATYTWTVASIEPAPAGILGAGFGHTCALTPSGAVDCWGSNTYGQAVDLSGPYKFVTTNFYHTCALTPSGAAECWGLDGWGQATDQPGTYASISAGYRHTCALTPSGAVDCWGDNGFGEAADQPGPYTFVSAGQYHTCALTPSGAVDCWGNVGYGGADQLGPYTFVSAGYYHTCALTPSGAVNCWGSNTYGQAGYHPGSYIFVTAGQYHTCALTSSNAVECWGDNTYSQLTGQAGTYTFVSTGQYHTCALTTSGVVECWGNNDDGQAGYHPGPYGLPFASPVIITQPLSQAVFVGATASFSASASGYPVPTVQWQVSADAGATWTDIPAATSTSYSFTAAYAQNGYQYRALFTNSQGSATSNAATLTVSNQTVTVTSLTSSQNPVDQYVPFTLTATVSPTPDGGTVAFKDEGVVITGCGAQVVTAGQATCTTAMQSRIHFITAEYSGYGSYQPSISPVYLQGVMIASPDLTPPVITPSVQGTLGQNGWYTSDVSLIWVVADSQSTVTSMTGCDPVSITNDQPATSYTCTAASPGGTASVTVSIQRDATPPALSPVVTPDPVLLNGSAVANPNATDAVSGVASAACDPVVTSSVGLHTVACSATDNAGNTTSAGASFTVVIPSDYVISGVVYDDLNGNGSRDAGEVGIEQAPVILALNLDQIPFNYLTAWSTADGSFQFILTPPAGGLPAGFSVSVYVAPVTGYKFTQMPEPFAALTGNLTGMDIGVHIVVLTPTPAGFPDGVQGVNYNQTITVTGGDAPYTFTPSTWPLPAGLSYAFDEQLGTITLSGTPTETGEFLAHIDFRDANGAFAQVHEYFTIHPPMLFNPLTLPDGSLGSAYNQTITVSGGMPPYAFVMGSEQWLPAGLTLDTSNGSIVISGTPSEAGRVTLDVYVSDQSGTTIEVQRSFWIKTAPSLTLSSSLNPALEGQPVTFNLGSTATVADWPAPWGQVTFKADGTAISGCEGLWMGSNPETEEPAPNPVTCTTSSLAVGAHAITAELTTLYGPYTNGTATLPGGQTVNADVPVYQSTGFTAPVDLGGVLNTAKAGQMIPLKWRLLDAAGNPVTDLDPADAILAVGAYACQAGIPTDPIETYTSGTTLLQNLGNGYYQLNWKTEKSYANTCKQITLEIDTWSSDGFTALFRFNR